MPNKKAKPSQEEENIDVEMLPMIASSSGLAGGATGAPGETLKRKREETDSDPGIDIDFLNTSEKLSAPNGTQKSSNFADPLQKWLKS